MLNDKVTQQGKPCFQALKARQEQEIKIRVKEQLCQLLIHNSDDNHKVYSLNGDLQSVDYNIEVIDRRDKLTD